jgi:hypothetical protein
MYLLQLKYAVQKALIVSTKLTLKKMENKLYEDLGMILKSDTKPSK